ncbi:Putative stress-induced transcription regulator [Lentzea fradiae]|uniref:Putative stress-induced transcription regulator n=1 Tax=Lentzea fradiae TaxID=200378 RepID=A0A1G7VRT3_9PSEU|nr:CGNR zinc finger domain-containing protein [Lentzea fradiae]SDG61610.1 Putative stress-induced transcription regulator [Lentzea fradiae]
MRFAPDTEMNLAFMVVLCNTEAQASRSGEDELLTVEALHDLLREHGYTGRFDRDEAELRDVREVRALLRQVWTLSRDEAVEAVNKMLRDAHALPRLVRHDTQDWHIHATEPDAPLAERLRAEAALALIDVIRTDEMDRLRICAADDCEGLLLDLSRNGLKRFCGVRCGNRMNMIAFRERRAGAAGRVT